MKSLLLLTLLAATTQALLLDTEWESFKLKFGKQYRSVEEHQYRKDAFADNLVFVERHNNEHALGLHTFTVGINKFSDMSGDEFKKQYLSPIPLTQTPPQKIKSGVKGDWPDSINWVEKGYVTGVKDQDDQDGKYVACAACWAFSATGTMEAAHYGKTGQLVSLSEQNLVDCATEGPNAGCSGGYPLIGIQHVIWSGGIESEVDYPFRAENEACKFNRANVSATFTNVNGITRYDEDELTYGVGNFGPFSTCIDATGQAFMQYRSGIYSNPDCSIDYLDHAVLTVGYGTENGQDFWLVKNSWGTYWGDEGYFKMARNAKNMCGIASNAVIAIA